MPKTIITLQGKPDCGKTATIKLAYEQLQAEGTVIYDAPRFTEEILKALEIDGVRVGFASVGDVAGRLEDYLERLLHLECAVIVCAVRLQRGVEQKVLAVVERLAIENQFEIDPIEKIHDRADKDAANHRMAREIIAHVRRAIERAGLVEA
jgi:hypothetical protein